MASTNKQLAAMAHDAVAEAAKRLGEHASSRLAGHHRTGNAKIAVEKVGAVDYLVALEDSAWLSIEFGRAGFDNGQHHAGPMQPLRILRGAVEDAAT